MDYKKRMPLLRKRIRARGFDSFMVPKSECLVFQRLCRPRLHDIGYAQEGFFLNRLAIYTGTRRSPLEGFTIELVKGSAYSALRETSRHAV